MSHQATTWVLHHAPNLLPHLVATLLGLADHAHPDGTCAFPAVPTLAKYTRKSTRAVQHDLSELLGISKAKKVKLPDGTTEVIYEAREQLIEVGDQRLVAHIPADRRPTVYNLLIHKRAAGSTEFAPRPQSGKAPAPVVVNEAPAPQEEKRKKGSQRSGKGKNFGPNPDAPRGAANPPAVDEERCMKSGHMASLARNCIACMGEAKGKK